MFTQVLTKDSTWHKAGLIRYRKQGNLIITGIYDGNMFQGSDRLSMAVAQDFAGFSKLVADRGYIALFEGDRWMNSKFREAFDPFVIRITDNGYEGRKRRDSQQTQEHIKRIATRVANYGSDIDVPDSTAALALIQQKIHEATSATAR